MVYPHSDSARHFNSVLGGAITRLIQLIEYREFTHVSLSLKQLGFKSHFATQAAQYGIGQPYRVTEDFGLRFVVTGEVQGQLQPFDLVFARKPQSPPIIGDWILAQPAAPGAVELIDILERSSCFQRSTDDNGVQALAANIDKLFVVTSCTDEFNLSRLERFLLLAHANHIAPVIVLNKADLVADPTSYLAQIAELGRDLPYCVLSTLSQEGIPQLEALLTEGDTGVFVGSSGVGKSSIVNTLIGKQRQATLGVSANGARGSHTTTSRSLFVLPGQGVIVDTPGIRSVGVTANAESLNDAFEDIAHWMTLCKFRNCGHEGEVGCAVIQAIADGHLTPRRLNSFRKLQREAEFFENKHAVLRRQRDEGKQRAARRISRERFERDPK